jgi:hypothetical protein
MTSKRFY